MTRRSRRGVLLLVVLALLAMFAMVAVAFVVLTQSELRSSDRARSVETVVDDPSKTAEQAINVIVRGNPNFCWSLLEKIYGDATIGTVAAPATMSQTTLICNGQLIEFTLPQGNDPFHWVGCVLTMLTGPAAGLSTHIVGINPQNYNVQIAAFDGGVRPQQGNQYIVNGFPYGGMGFGFNPATGALTQVNTSVNIPLAFTPNAPPSAWGLVNGLMPGGVNSDYTAPDQQDPLLAFAVPNPNGNGGVLVPIPSLHRADLIAATNAMNNVAILRQVMYRPNTIDHPNFTGSNPNPGGFNPLWDGITPGQGSWDVDNQGTGVPDSVWVDLGLPVRHTADGRAYKPLIAVLILDMDGRLNLNAHGSLAQTQGGYYNSPNVKGYQSVMPPALQNLDPGPGSTQLPGALGTAAGHQAFFAGPVGTTFSTPPINIPRGQGTGPAEVNLLPLFRVAGGPANFSSSSYQNLLTGNGTSMGRYGSNGVPGIRGTGSVLSQNRAFPYNGDVNGKTYWSNFAIPGNANAIFDAYGSPGDHQTLGAVGLDRAGRPLYISLGGPLANGPYDIDLSHNAPYAVDLAPVNDPFGAAELERLLRCYDRDAASLPQRLFSLTNTGNGSILQSRRAEFTTQSWNVPVASPVLPLPLRKLLPGGRSWHPVDLLQAKILLSGGNASNLDALRTQLLPWEILEGLKMDINRPFGAGAFSMNPAYQGQSTLGAPQIVPDQPGMAKETVPQIATPGKPPVTAQFNYSADGGVVSNLVKPNVAVDDSLTARQLFARHLYILTLALADSAALAADYQKANPTATAAVVADSVSRTIAQWAVNVVAYRDHNGVMIPFPYDPAPFGGNGWNPDNTPLHTVWGCKRPELLITETLAFHDRRTQDLADEVVDVRKQKFGATKTRVSGGLTTSSNPKTHDPSFNSRYRPQGSLFVELYNPWTILEPRTADLSAVDPVTNLPGVQLNKVTPAVGGRTSPVWRLIIVDPTVVSPTNGDELPDPDNATLTPAARQQMAERAAYFVNVTGMALPGDGKVSYFPSVNSPGPLVVPPSGYAVVGSGDNNQANRTYIGFETNQTAGKPGSTRLVTMNAADLTDGRVVKNTLDQPTGTIPPKVLGIDYAQVGNGTPVPQRMSVSEPTGGYPPYELDGSGKPVVPNPLTGHYDTETLDMPPDQQRDTIAGGPEPGIWALLNRNGTTAAYRIIYLQRLADPTRPWASDSATSDPRQWNPYRTVDAMTVDLTVFNGLTTAVDPTSTVGVTHFESHQRGEKNYLPLDGPTEMDLWKQEPANKQQVGWTGGGAAPFAACNFNLPLNQSLGFLNKPFQPPSGAAPSTPPGDSLYPFPWLNWSYRPFNNVYELLLVPALSSSRLMARNTADPRRYFGYVDGNIRRGGAQDVYDGSTSAQVPYPHLLNFFESGQSSKTGLSSQLGRLFAYVGVPSRFADSQLQMRPDLAGQPDGPANFFHTPFNQIPRYRVPGNINLNTISSSDELFGAMNLYFMPLAQNMQLNPLYWDKFVRSRRGGGAASPNPNTSVSLNNMVAGVNPNTPSRFMQPFRTPGGESLTASAEPGREVDVTLLRPDPDANLRPLFGLDDSVMGPTSNPTLTPDAFTAAGGISFACMDYNRNPYFRYQVLQKLGSVASTHSNVFAIWITIGYFEVYPNTNTNPPGGVDAGHPDGYMLGPEMGSDTGDVVRHRAFYIFDRSIPVGFMRGQDINHWKAFLVNRFIE